MAVDAVLWGPGKITIRDEVADASLFLPRMVVLVAASWILYILRNVDTPKRRSMRTIAVAINNNKTSTKKYFFCRRPGGKVVGGITIVADTVTMVR